MEIKIELHRGICSNCKSGMTKQYIKPEWVMCYRLPIEANIDKNALKIGEHIDLCFTCITREFEKVDSKNQ